MNAKELENLLASGVPKEKLIDMIFDSLNQAIKEAQDAHEESKHVAKAYVKESAEYRERWLDSERQINVLTQKLAYANQVIDQRNAELSRGHADFMQALTDPENQPSQWGTVTLSAYQALETQIREMRMAFKELRRVINGEVYLGSPPKRSLHSQALKIIGNALGDGHD